MTIQSPVAVHAAEEDILVADDAGHLRNPLSLQSPPIRMTAKLLRRQQQQMTTPFRVVVLQV